MRILLDDRDTTLHADTIATALQEAATLAERSGRMIVEVHVDGIAWGEEDLASAEHVARGAKARASRGFSRRWRSGARCRPRSPAASSSES
jgi:hypothetical protein